MKKIAQVGLITMAALLLAMPCAALKEGSTYSYNPSGTSIPAPTSYEVQKVIYGNDMGVDSLWNPEDMHVDSQGLIYIADTGNDRILILDSGFKIKEIVDKVFIDGQESTFSRPKGVFKANDGLLYICDTENARVIAINQDKKVMRNMNGDDLIAKNENIIFKPEKIAVTDDKIAYVVASDIYQGILQFSADDKFTSFFAPNDVEVTSKIVVLNMWKNLFSSQQQDELEKTLPSPYNNIFLSSDQLLYTTASNVKVGDEMKAMNSLGINILRTPQTKDSGAAFGDLEVSFENNEYVTSRFIDIHADSTGLFCGLDATMNRIFQYDKECNLISVFGGLGTQEGQFDAAVAIEKLGDNYLVLDKGRRCVTVFTSTPYTNDVLQALSYYNKGLYVESVEQWKDILKQNSNFSIAYKSIGRAYLQEGKSKQAMQMLKKGEDKYFYSLALKEYRKEFTRQNLLWIIGGVALVLCFIIVLFKYIRKKLLS